MTAKVPRIQKAMRNGMNGYSNQQEDQNGDLQKKSFSLFTIESWGRKPSWILCRIIKVKGTGVRSKALLFVPWVAGLLQATQFLEC